jgi:hypothetical protein
MATRWREDGAVAVARSAGANMRLRREGKGVTGCSRAPMREDERGKKGGHSSDGAPFIRGCGGAGHDSWAAPRGGEGRGWAWGQRGGGAWLAAT